MKMIEGWPLVEALRRIRERRPFMRRTGGWCGSSIGEPEWAGRG